MQSDCFEAQMCINASRFDSPLRIIIFIFLICIYSDLDLSNKRIPSSTIDRPFPSPREEKKNR